MKGFKRLDEQVFDLAGINQISTCVDLKDAKL